MSSERYLVATLKKVLARGIFDVTLLVVERLFFSFHSTSTGSRLLLIDSIDRLHKRTQISRISRTSSSRRNEC